MPWVWITLDQSEATRSGSWAGANNSGQSEWWGCGLHSARLPAAGEEKRAQEVEVFVTKWGVGPMGRGPGWGRGRVPGTEPKGLVDYALVFTSWRGI